MSKTAEKAEVAITVDSYLGERKQKVRIIQDEQRGWFAVSNICKTSESGNEHHLEALDLKPLDKAAKRHPGIAFRQSDNHLEAYAPLTGRYEALANVPAPALQLSDVDIRLVEYLAHAADRLEFEFSNGMDNE